MDYLDYKIKNSHKYNLISLKGVLNIQTINKFFKEIDSNVGYKKILILDLLELQYIDSSGIGILMDIVKELQKNKLHLYIVNANDKVYKVIKFVGFSKYIKIIDKEALKLIQKQDK